MSSDARGPDLSRPGSRGSVGRTVVAAEAPGAVDGSFPLRQTRSMTQRCEQCRRPIRGRAQRSFTGRVLCERCNDRILGASAGHAVGGGLGNAVSTAGWFSRVKQFASGRRPRR